MSFFDHCKRNHACGRPIDKRDGSGKTWLHKACASNDTAAFDWLLEQGANVNIPDNAGRTALHESAKQGNAYMIQRLLDMGALHLAQTTGDRPIHNAVDFSHAHVLPLFAAYVNERGALGWTPLMIAAKYKRLECVEMLLRLGADVNMSTRDGYAPLIAASQSQYLDNNEETIQLLLEHGAVQNVRYEGRSSIDYLLDYESNKTVIQLVLKMGGKSRQCPDRHLTRRAELLALVE